MNNKCIADDNYILADDKLRKALDSIVIELNVHGTGLDDQRFIEWHCDDDLRQRYGDKQLIEMAHRRFGSCSPVLSEKATQWYHQFNDEYFAGRLQPYFVFVHYGHEMGRPLADHNEYDTLNIYGAWEDHVLIGLLLREMIYMATEMTCERIREAEFIRLDGMGAPFHKSCAEKERSTWDGLDGPRQLSDTEADVAPHPAWAEMAELWQADRKWVSAFDVPKAQHNRSITYIFG